MTETSSETPPRLGMKALYSEAFAIFLHRLPLFLGLGLLPMLALTFLHEIAVLKLNSQFDSSINYVTTYEYYLAYFRAWYWAVYLAVLIGYCFFYSLVLGAALSIAQGEPVRLGILSGLILRYFVPIFIFTVILQILYSLALFVLIVPALYIAARYACLFPSILAEHSSWDSWSRAADLSQGYRWPIVLLFLPMSLFALGEYMWYLYDPGEPYVTVNDAVNATLKSTFGFLFTAVFASVLNACLFYRLLEIKQGHTEATIERVFD